MSGIQWPGIAKLALYALVYLAVISAFAFLLFEPGERLGYVIVVVALTALGIGTALSPAFEGAFNRLISLFLRVSAWLFASLLPLALARAGSDYLLNTAPPLLQLLIMITWGLLLFAASFAVMHGGTRARMFGRMQGIGSFAPLVYSLNLLLISVQFFAAGSYVLVEAGRLELSLGSASALSADSLGDFYLWHFANAIPVLKVTDTLLWKEPLLYDQARVGWVLLLFKVSVIMPVIAAYQWSWTRFKEARAATA